MAAKQVAVVDVIKTIFALILSMLTLEMCAQTPSTSTTEKRAIAVALLYDYYQQDGNNSAVTGGIGTEALTYHAPEIVVHLPVDSLGIITAKAGVDVYSSASQDNIDFVVSSASARDARTHLWVGYSNEKPKSEISYAVNVSGSIESDYTSLGVGVNAAKGWKNGNSILQVGLQFYADDCRWGRLNDDVKELRLVYPSELRYKEWYNTYKRYTTTLSLGFNQLINKRLKIGLYVDGVWQDGLLATPFHRVYFANGSLGVEQLPYNRYKLPMAIRANYFAKKRLLLRSYYRYYTDSWGINAHTVEIESAYKIKTFLSVMPFYRFYSQTGAFWFGEYETHLVGDVYFTSDFDLSAFTAHQFGVGINYKPVKGIFTPKSAKYGWQGLQLRFGTYRRSTGLNAYFLSSIFYLGKI